MNCEIPSNNEIYTGWYVDRVYVAPITAYRHRIDWFTDFLKLFPEKEVRMQEYSKKQGWTNVVFAQHWVPVTIAWLNKNYSEIEV